MVGSGSTVLFFMCLTLIWYSLEDEDTAGMLLFPSLDVECCYVLNCLSMMPLKLPSFPTVTHKTACCWNPFSLSQLLFSHVSNCSPACCWNPFSQLLFPHISNCSPGARSVNSIQLFCSPLRLQHHRSFPSFPLINIKIIPNLWNVKNHIVGFLLCLWPEMYCLLIIIPCCTGCGGSVAWW